MFALRAQCFAARRQNVQARRLLKQPLRHCGDLGDQMFGTIEHEKGRLAPDMRNERGDWIFRLHGKAER